MRLISLDFDGPMHPVSVVDSLPLYTGALVPGFPGAEDLGLFRHLPVLRELLVAHPDVDIAVHSSWRKFADNTALRGWLGDDLAQRFIGITSLELPRQRGIEELAQRAGVEHLLVIDDDRNSFAESFEPLVLVDPDTGLSDGAVQRLIAAWLLETA